MIGRAIYYPNKNEINCRCCSFGRFLLKLLLYYGILDISFDVTCVLFLVENGILQNKMESFKMFFFDEKFVCALKTWADQVCKLQFWSIQSLQSPSLALRFGIFVGRSHSGDDFD